MSYGPHTRLAISSAVMDAGLSEQFPLNDGMVPSQSGSFADKGEITKHEFFDYDHLDMRDGKTENGTIRLFNTVKADLEAILGPIGNSKGITLTGNIASPGQVNKYSFTVTTPGKYVIYTGGTTHTCGTLYDWNYNSIGRTECSGGELNNFRIEYSISAPGTYYVEVAGYWGSTGSYELHIEGPSGIALTGLTINGPSSVNEHSTATYTATASWSNGSTSTVTPSWSENSAYASISVAGVLTTTTVASNQTVMITATFTYSGITKTATKTVTIVNVPLTVVSITAIDATATEVGPTTGTLRVSRSGSTTSSLIVYYGTSGTAASGSDYNSLPGSITIPAGSATADITITPINDTSVESDETVIVTLSANVAYTIGSPNSATVTIISDDSLVCGTPSSITVPASDSDGNYTISWGASSTSGVTYVLQEATNSGFTSGLRTAYAGTGLSASITGKTNGTYYYRVKATKSGYTDSAWRTGSNGCVVTIEELTVDLPKTGQTTIYASGDDGYIKAGVSWPTPRFTVSGDCVTDNLTGLM